MNNFQKTNPELAAEKMEEQEMTRTLERANLKHSKANKSKKLAFMQQVSPPRKIKLKNAQIRSSFY